jgi:hypothetical protein
MKFFPHFCALLTGLRLTLPITSLAASWTTVSSGDWAVASNWQLGATEPAPYSPGSSEDLQSTAFENDFNFPGISRAMTVTTSIPQPIGGFTNIGVGGDNVGSLDVQPGGALTLFRGGVFVGRNGGEGALTVSGGDLRVGIVDGPEGSGGNFLRVGDGVGAVGRVEITAGDLIIAGATEAQVNGATSGVIEIQGGTLSTNHFGELGPLARVVVSGGILIVRVSSASKVPRKRGVACTCHWPLAAP